jgi:hypothetical protein
MHSVGMVGRERLHDREFVVTFVVFVTFVVHGSRDQSRK